MNPYVRRSLVVLAISGTFVAALLSGAYRCPVAMVTGVPCPGCGMTRATVAALHGHWHESVHYHPLALLVVPLFGLYVGAHAVSYIRHGKSNVDQVLAARWVTVVSVLIFATMLAVWIARFFGAFGGPAPV